MRERHTDLPAADPLLLGAVCAFCVGAWARLSGLGDAPLATDEYYFVSSVHRILEVGLPVFPDGGLYARGLLPQYATAGAVALLGDGGVAWRLPAALCGLASVPVSFLYARCFSSRGAALCVASLVALSSWEIEFSRFARMYAPFQLTTLLFLLSLERARLTRSFGRALLPCGCLLLAAATHELAVLLTPLLLLPLGGALPELWSSRTRRVLQVATTATALAAIALAFCDLRGAGVESPYPLGFTPEADSRLRLPLFPVLGLESALARSALPLLLLGLPAALTAWSWPSDPRCARRRRIDALCVAAVTACALHQLALATLLVAWLLGREDVLPLRAALPRTRLLLATAAALALVWIALAFWSAGWRDHPPLSGLGEWRALRLFLFGWPDLYAPVVSVWRDAFPLLGGAAAVAIAAQLWALRSRPTVELVRHPAFLLAGLITAFGFLRGPELTSRYTFFAYPLVLCVLALALEGASRRWLAGRARTWTIPASGLAALLLVFLGSRDFNPLHLLRAGEPAYQLRAGALERHAPVWYPRADLRGPGEFVNRAVEPRDESRTIAVGQPATSWYLDHPHAVYLPRSGPRFRRVSRAGGSRDLWSGEQLLSTPEELRSYARDARHLWLIQAQGTHALFDPRAVFGETARLETVHEGVDGRIGVTLVLPAPAASGADR